MNKFAKICLVFAGVIMLTFFVVQTVLYLVCVSPHIFLLNLVIFVLSHYFPFFYVVYDFIKTTRTKEANIDLQLNAIDKSNLVVMLDTDGYILEANDKFCNMMGCREKDLKFKRHSQMVPKEYAKSLEYIEFWDKLRRGESITGEFERVSKDGKSHWLFGNYTPIRD